MIDDLLEQFNNADEREEFYEERTAHHIHLVQKAAKRIVQAYPELKRLLLQVEYHDASKLVEPERTPYIDIPWKKKLERSNHRLKKRTKQLFIISRITHTRKN